jgi:DNA-binding LacI/PurR family transcriptional regulator
MSAVEESGLPTVMLWEDPPSQEIFSVADEDVRVGQTATEYLLGLGHRRVVAFLSEPAQSSVRKKRLAGWEQALRKAGERHPKHFVINCSVEPGAEAIVGSYERLRRWLFQNGNRLPATSVFCLDWTGALGMLRALREVGIEVPRDVSILTHGGTNRLCEFTNPALSVIQSNTADFAAEALGLLKSACLGDSPAERAILLPASITERESTAPPPN